MKSDLSTLFFIFCLIFSENILVSVGVSLSKTTVPYLLKQGNKELLAKNWESALQTFQSVLEEEPANGFAQANIGVVFSRMDRHKEALLAYEKALKMGYDNHLFRYNRGRSFALLNLYEEAELEFKTALKMNSRLVLAEYDLGVLFNLQRRTDEALKQVSKLYPRNEKLAQKLYKSISGPYKSITVDNGGHLSGQVKLEGPKPTARSFHLIHSPNIEYCNRMSDGKGHRIVHDFLRSENLGLKDTIIAIQGVKRGKPFIPEMYSFKIKLCHAKDYTIAIRNGTDFIVENLDPIQHEIATYEVARESGKKGFKRTLNNSARFDQKTNRPVTPNSSQVRPIFIHPTTNQFIIKCNLHPFLQTYAWVVDNPYFTVTDAQGRFKISDIPPGIYKVVAWHPYMAPKRGSITIKSGKTHSLNFSFKSADDKRKLYSNDIKGYRFNTWYDSNEKFYGGKRIDDPIEVLQTFN